MLLFTRKPIILIAVFITSFFIAIAQPSNDNCANAISLFSDSTATPVSGTLNNATQSFAAIMGSCVAWSTNYDVWYKFTATKTSHTVTMAGFGSNFWNREMQVYNGGVAPGTCPTVSTGYAGCASGGITSLNVTTIVGNVYFIRISDSWSSMTWGGEFTVSVSHRNTSTTNNTCVNAITLNQGASCNATLANLQNAANSSPTGACGSATATTTYDVWFKFDAKATSVNIRLNNLGSNLSSAIPYIELFSASGACTGFTSLSCTNGNTIPLLDYSGLTINSTYYIRVYTTTNPTAGVAATWNFDICVSNPIIVGGRTNEVFKQTLLVSPNTPSATDRLADPWEIAYGPDDSLWVTEAKGYKVKKIHPVNGGQRTVLNLADAASGGTFTPSSFRRQFARTQDPWPQGGMMGLAIHPDFNHPTLPQKKVYVAYVRSYVTPFKNVTDTVLTSPTPGDTVKGFLFYTSIVRFDYDGANLINPIIICDTIKGSSDHNSGRMIIKPEGGTNYLFYAVGDMGAGQFTNIRRTIKSQDINSYEGKILRFNLQQDADLNSYDQWIPNSNPFNATLGKQSAVWSTGIRNNQGFAYNSSLNILYGSSHGPFSDDEINIIEGNKNYGHPRVVGDSTDGNYNNAKAGPSNGSLPLITSESANAININALGVSTGTTYKNPLFNYYAAVAGNNSTAWSVQYIYNNQPYPGTPNTGAQSVNQFWKSEGISGMDVYTNSAIPGWKNSLLNGALKGGRILRNQLNVTGTNVIPIDGGDTVTYFRGVNRFRDLAISPDGKNIFSVIDSSSSTSGPTTASPVISSCRGCLQRYTFLGYFDNAGASTIPTYIPIAPGVNNQIRNNTPTSILSADNNNLWVPITDSLGNIIAEIDANRNNLGTITGSLYKHNGAIRTSAANRPYLDRSITINVQNAPDSNVNIRLYLTAAELATLVAAPSSGVADINSLYIFKNNDTDASSMTASTTRITPTRAAFGSDYVLTASISGFSSFYFGGAGLVAAEALTLKGKYNLDNSVNLDWSTLTETNSSHFNVQRSIDGVNFININKTTALGNTSTTSRYNLIDKDLPITTNAVVYYRVELIGKDGSVKLSNTIAIDLPQKITVISVSPNPAVNSINLNINGIADENSNYRIFDNTGRQVKTADIKLKKGINTFNVNISYLAKGMYYIHFSGISNTQKTKFVKM